MLLVMRATLTDSSLQEKLVEDGYVVVDLLNEHLPDLPSRTVGSVWGASWRASTRRFTAIQSTTRNT